METPSDRVREKWRAHARLEDYERFPLLQIGWTEALLRDYHGNLPEVVAERQKEWSVVWESVFDEVRSQILDAKESPTNWD